MNKYVITALVVGLISSVSLLAIKQVKISDLSKELASQTLKSSPEWLFRHQQEVWLANLEWCESRGIPSAVNPKDNDNTPSFGAFQFKPGTFAGYGKKYGLTGSLMNYDSQKTIMARMMDDPDVKWAKEFPACIAKIGLPPIKF